VIYDGRHETDRRENHHAQQENISLKLVANLIQSPFVLYGGPSLSHVFLASKQRSTSFSNGIINSIRVFILFYLRFTLQFLF